MILEIQSLDTINETAQKFIEQIGDRTVFASVCETLGVKETVNSPTFAIVNEYEAADGRIIYHFDCYRINKFQEALDMGAEEYLYSGNLCFIEWSENIAPILPDFLVNVDIVELENGRRNVIIR